MNIEYHQSNLQENSLINNKYHSESRQPINALNLRPSVSNLAITYHQKDSKQQSAPTMAWYSYVGRFPIYQPVLPWLSGYGISLPKNPICRTSASIPGRVIQKTSENLCLQLCALSSALNVVWRQSRSFTLLWALGKTPNRTLPSCMVERR